MSDYDIDFDYMINYISDHCDFLEEDNHYDNVHEAIDDYVVQFEYDMKKIVNDYGVFKAIKLYKDDFGEYVIDDSESKNYMLLGYIIIKDLFNNKYPDYTDVINAINADDESGTDPHYRCDGGCGKIVGYGKDHECKRVCDDCEDEYHHSDSDVDCEKCELDNAFDAFAIHCN